MPNHCSNAKCQMSIGQGSCQSCRCGPEEQDWWMFTSMYHSHITTISHQTSGMLMVHESYQICGLARPATCSRSTVEARRTGSIEIQPLRSTAQHVLVSTCGCCAAANARMTLVIDSVVSVVVTWSAIRCKELIHLLASMPRWHVFEINRLSAPQPTWDTTETLLQMRTSVVEKKTYHLWPFQNTKSFRACCNWRWRSKLVHKGFLTHNSDHVNRNSVDEMDQIMKIWYGG